MPYFYHSAFRNIPWLRVMQEHPEAMINTRTALGMGIKEGDWIFIETPHGRAKAIARLTEGINPREHRAVGCKVAAMTLLAARLFRDCSEIVRAPQVSE
jgi:anaerobic selenocysteine-containing dehydrogenase